MKNLIKWYYPTGVGYQQWQSTLPIKPVPVTTIMFTDLVTSIHINLYILCYMIIMYCRYTRHHLITVGVNACL